MFGVELLLYYICCCHRCNRGDHDLFYSIYVVSYWIEFLPSCYYVEINWRISELYWSFYFGILIFPILVVGSCMFSYLGHIIILYITIIDIWRFFFGCGIPVEILFLLLILSVKESLRLENCSLFTIYLLLWIGRDLIFLFFPLLFSFSLFLVPEVVCSTFLFIESIFVASNFYYYRY